MGWKWKADSETPIRTLRETPSFEVTIRNFRALWTHVGFIGEGGEASPKTGGLGGAAPLTYIHFCFTNIKNNYYSKLLAFSFHTCQKILRIFFFHYEIISKSVTFSGKVVNRLFSQTYLFMFSNIFWIFYPFEEENIFFLCPKNFNFLIFNYTSVKMKIKRVLG